MDIFGPFKVKGDYWIIERDEEYQWIVVGNPKRKGYWILARTLNIEDSLFNELTQRAHTKGFDLSDIERPDNSECPL